MAIDIKNQPKGQWFFNLMLEIKGMKDFDVNKDIIQEWLINFIENTLKKPKKYGCNLLNHYYSEFTKAITDKKNGIKHNKTNTMYWFDDADQLFTTNKEKNDIIGLNKIYKEFENLAEYFDLCNEESKPNNKTMKLPKRTDIYNTILTRKQISLLAYFLRKNKFILPNTTYVLLADCFGKMTDFSSTQIEKDYKGLRDIIDITDNKKDYETLIDN